MSVYISLLTNMSTPVMFPMSMWEYFLWQREFKSSYKLHLTFLLSYFLNLTSNQLLKRGMRVLQCFLKSNFSLEALGSWVAISLMGVPGKYHLAKSYIVTAYMLSCITLSYTHKVIEAINSVDPFRLWQCFSHRVHRVPRQSFSMSWKYSYTS